ncbi:methionyl-tRNA formyltransferase [Patescibacteria group bacterium]
MKVIFCGTPDFAVPFLISLIYDKDIEVEAVVTQPDKPVGRKQILTPPAVKEIAIENNLPVLQPDSINDDFLELIRNIEPDFIVVIAYGVILPQEMIDIPKRDCINVHASLLPKYRGASPIQTSLLNGDKETGLTIMQIDKELDKGGIYMLRKVAIDSTDTTEILSKRLSEIGAIILPSALKDIEEEVLSPLKQDENDASYCKKISKKDAQIDPEKDDAEKILNKLRAFTPWPGIYMDFQEKRLKVLHAKASEEKANPGELKGIDGSLILGTKKDSIELFKVQMEGKNPVSAKEFINGFLK